VLVRYAPVAILGNAKVTQGASDVHARDVQGELCVALYPGLSLRAMSRDSLKRAEHINRNRRNGSHNTWCILFQCSEHVRVQVGDPLFPFLSNSQVPQGTLDVRAQNVPIGFCVAVTQVAGRLISELLGEADLLELIEKAREPE